MLDAVPLRTPSIAITRRKIWPSLQSLAATSISASSALLRANRNTVEELPSTFRVASSVSERAARFAVRASASCECMAANVIATRSKLLQIMALHAKEIPRDPETRAALAQFLAKVAQFKIPSPAEVKATDKLQPIASGEDAAIEASAKKPKSTAKSCRPKAVRESESFWELPGESELRAVTTPDPPQAKKQATVRLTHAN